MGESFRKLVGVKRKNTHIHIHTPELRMEEVGCLSHASFLTLSMLLSQKMRGWERRFNRPYLYLCNTLGTVPMGISHALARSLNSVGGEFLFS